MGWFGRKRKPLAQNQASTELHDRLEELWARVPHLDHPPMTDIGASWAALDSWFAGAVSSGPVNPYEALRLLDELAVLLGEPHLAAEGDDVREVIFLTRQVLIDASDGRTP